MNYRNKRALCIGIFGYLAAVGLTCGMLRTAQVTRKTLYGGQPVMAQVVQEDDNTRTVMLGGGEWEITVKKTDGSTVQRIAAVLPPGLFRWMLRLTQLADQTAEYMTGESTSQFCS